MSLKKLIKTPKPPSTSTITPLITQNKKWQSQKETKYVLEKGQWSKNSEGIPTNNLMLHSKSSFFSTYNGNVRLQS